MPPPIPVELEPHSPDWLDAAAREAQRLAEALGPQLVAGSPYRIDRDPRHPRQAHPRPDP